MTTTMPEAMSFIKRLSKKEQEIDAAKFVVMLNDVRALRKAKVQELDELSRLSFLRLDNPTEWHKLKLQMERVQAFISELDVLTRNVGFHS